MLRIMSTGQRGEYGVRGEGEDGPPRLSSMLLARLKEAPFYRVGWRVGGGRDRVQGAHGTALHDWIPQR